FQSGFLVEEILDRCGGHSFFRDEIKHNAGIELSRACSHCQSIKCCEAECALNAAAICQRAHRGAAAQVRDDHASLRDVRSHIGQTIGDVFIGKSVEAVATHAFLIKEF